MTERTSSMSDAEEAVIYDAISQINGQAEVLVGLLNEHGTDEQKQAYKDCVYAVSMKLAIIIGLDGMKRGEARHAEIRRKIDDFVRTRKDNP